MGHVVHVVSGGCAGPRVHGLRMLLCVQRQAAAAVEAEAAAAAAEAERVERLRDEYEAAVPEEIRERVQAAVDKELVSHGCGNSDRAVLQHVVWWMASS